MCKKRIEERMVVHSILQRRKLRKDGVALGCVNKCEEFFWFLSSEDLNFLFDWPCVVWDDQRKACRLMRPSGVSMSKHT